MKEIFLCKCGEIVLKGANHSFFENALIKELKFRLRSYGSFKITHAQSTIYVEPTVDVDFDAVFSALSRVFGIVTIERAAVAEKSMESIAEVTKEYIPRFLEGKKTFKVEAKRADKRFPLKSPEIAAQTGGFVLSACPRMRVNVKEPDVTVKVEVREYAAYISAGSFKGAGGMPVGTSGKGLLLLSGGIDSPVAGYMMAKRGVKIDAVHFESFPYTSERAKEKVLELARLVTRYSGSMLVHVVSLTHIQEELVKNCDEDYFTLLLRRYMMAIAEKIAKQNDCLALITGESVGQVASQTMQAIAVTDNAVSMPVFRPCIGMDKEEIIQVSRKIDTFETSILPFEDCCTVFTPKHPRTKPEIEKVLTEERKLDFDALVEEALASAEQVYIPAEV
ncbi:MAG: tRNA 4-thiouridine(8) synthase ThiI [Ruminococcaceae bacterium]|nr:tRNA 4-thiouridine(8) synthase ThiI [Oscillospiraceae bacterium]